MRGEKLSLAGVIEIKDMLAVTAGKSHLDGIDITHLGAVDYAVDAEHIAENAAHVGRRYHIERR